MLHYVRFRFPWRRDLPLQPDGPKVHSDLESKQAQVVLLLVSKVSE